MDSLRALAGDADSAIFFLECDEEKESFGLLSECAFESAAAINPLAPVVVVANASAKINHFSPYIATMKNLHLAKIDFKKLTEGTVLNVSVISY